MKKEPYDLKKMHDETIAQGEGGDTHQHNPDKDILTTSTGTAVSDDAVSLRAGSRGPMLMEDFVFRNKVFHFDHERIPERVVHARGFAAHGFFESYENLSSLTMAAPLQEAGQITPAFVRFSTVAGNKGSSDLARDVRGFAVKLYTTQGNWDIVGNNIPVFFIQDPIKFPDLVHAAKDEPDRGFPQAQTAHDNFWDFISLMPESMHMIMWIMSDRAIPRAFRFMEGFGVHTFRLVNNEGKSSFVKFHWKPKLGMQSVTWDEAVKINGADPDYHRRDLWNAIQKGDFPEWELGLQIFDEAFAERFPFDVLDSTKLIPEEEVPVRTVGRLVLNRCVDNFFAETEQVAFCTQNIIPGIDFSNDPLLQGRNFSYLDTQLKRLGGPNFTHLPINAPKCPFANFEQDGHMAFFNPKGRINYNPNSAKEGPAENFTQGYRSFPEPVEGHKLRLRPESFADHYSQARQFFISQTPIEQKHIQDALIFELSKVEKEAIRTRMVSHLLNIDKKLAGGVAEGLGLKTMPEAAETQKPALENLKPSVKLSILHSAAKTFKGRNVGVVLSDGCDSILFSDIETAAQKEGVSLTLISPHIQSVTLSDGRVLSPHEKIGGAPAVLYDAVVILLHDHASLQKEQVRKLNEFMQDAWWNAKFIAYIKEAEPLLQNGGLKIDKGMFKLDQQDSVLTFLKACQDLRFWERIA